MGLGACRAAGGRSTPLSGQLRFGFLPPWVSGFIQTPRHRGQSRRGPGEGVASSLRGESWTSLCKAVRVRQGRAEVSRDPGEQFWQKEARLAGRGAEVCDPRSLVPSRLPSFLPSSRELGIASPFLASAPGSRGRGVTGWGTELPTGGFPQVQVTGGRPPPRGRGGQDPRPPPGCQGDMDRCRRPDGQDRGRESRASPVASEPCDLEQGPSPWES